MSTREGEVIDCLSEVEASHCCVQCNVTLQTGSRVMERASVWFFSGCGRVLSIDPSSRQLLPPLIRPFVEDDALPTRLRKDGIGGSIGGRGVDCECYHEGCLPHDNKGRSVKDWCGK